MRVNLVLSKSDFVDGTVVLLKLLSGSLCLHPDSSPPPKNRLKCHLFKVNALNVATPVVVVVGRRDRRPLAQYSVLPRDPILGADAEEELRSRAVGL